MAIRYDTPNGPAKKPWCDSCGQQIPPEGNGEPCYYCDEPCDGWAGNPSKWPIPLTHKNDPGKVKWHHIGCVSVRLMENVFLEGETLEAIFQDAMKWREHQKSNVLKHVDGEGDVTP